MHATAHTIQNANSEWKKTFYYNLYKKACISNNLSLKDGFVEIEISNA